MFSNFLFKFKYKIITSITEITYIIPFSPKSVKLKMATNINVNSTENSLYSDQSMIFDERPKVHRRIVRKKLSYIEPLDEPGTIYNAEVHQSAQRLLKVHRITKYVKFCNCCALPQETPGVVVPFNLFDKKIDFGLGIFLYFYYIKFCIIISFICIGLSSISTIIFSQNYANDIKNYYPSFCKLLFLSLKLLQRYK